MILLLTNATPQKRKMWRGCPCPRLPDGQRQGPILQCRGKRLRKNQMTLMRLLRNCTIKGLPHLLFSVSQFVAKGRPHLQNGVAESKLEDPSSDSLIGTLIA